MRLSLRCGARFLQRLHHAFHLFRQRPQEFASRRAHLSGFAAPQSLQPLRGLADRTHQAPANDQKRDEYNQQNFQRDVNQGLAPGHRALFADEASIMKDGQPHRFAVGAAHRQRVSVVIPRPERKKEPASLRVPGIHLGRQLRKGVLQGGGQTVGNGDALAGIIEDCRADDALTRAETVQRAAQLRCGGVPVQQRLQGVGQTQRRQARTLIQLLVQRLLLVLFLVVREQARNQRDTRDYRKHQPQTKSHYTVLAGLAEFVSNDSKSRACAAIRNLSTFVCRLPQELWLGIVSGSRCRAGKHSANVCFDSV